MLLLAVPSGLAGAPSARAERRSIRRLLAAIDFEADHATGEELPQGWDKTKLPGGKFPRYVTGRLTDRVAHAGKVSFTMALDRSNVAYCYTRGVPAFPDSDYLLTGWVRTEKLKVARAQARLFLTDALGKAIDGAESLGEPMGGPDSPADGKWRRFSVRLRGAHVGSEKLCVTLSLVQPEIWQGPAGRFLDLQDLHGQVWWDDLAIYRVPRISLGTDVTANVFAPGVRPRLRIRMEGLDYAECGIVLTIRDAAGVLRSQRIIDSAPTTAPAEWALELPNLGPGLYEAQLDISAADNVLVTKRTWFAVLCELPRTGKSRLGIDATAVPPEQWNLLPTMSRHLRFSELKLSAWPQWAPAPDEAEPPQTDAALRALLARLSEGGVRTTLVFGEVPPALRESVDGTPSIITALAAGTQTVVGAMDRSLARYGQTVAAWQIGAADDADPLSNPALAEAYRAARQKVRRFLAADNVMLAWHASHAYDLDGPGRLSLLIGPTAMPALIGEQLADFAGKVDQVHLRLEAGEVNRLGHLADLARRYAHTRAAGIKRVFIDPPWRSGPAGQIEPTEVLLVARTLAAYLGDADYLGTFRLDETSWAMAFAKPAGEGLLLVFADPGRPGDRQVTLDLQRDAHAVDLWGHRRPLPRSGGRVTLRPGLVPFLVAGCDPKALALRASLQFDPPLLLSLYMDHTARLSFRNPYTRTLRGKLRITPPDRWDVKPDTISVNVPPGQRQQLDLRVRFPYNADGGATSLAVTLEVGSPQPGTLRVPLFFYLGLKTIRFDATASVDADGGLHVRQAITNVGPTSESFYCYAQVPGRPRLSRVLQGLAPGDTVVKTFLFPGAAALRGQSLRTGLRQVGGPAMMNRSMVIP